MGDLVMRVDCGGMRLGGWLLWWMVVMFFHGSLISQETDTLFLNNPSNFHVTGGQIPLLGRSVLYSIRTNSVVFIAVDGDYPNIENETRRQYKTGAIVVSIAPVFIGLNQANNKISLFGQAGKHLDELLVGLGADDRLPVDYKGGRALHAKLLGCAGFLLDEGGVFAGIQALVEGCGLQAELLGKAFELVFAEGTLVFAGLSLEQQIVIFPELILIGGAFAGFRRPLRLIP
jgi:hypothetical protein